MKLHFIERVSEKEKAIVDEKLEKEATIYSNSFVGWLVCICDSVNIFRHDFKSRIYDFDKFYKLTLHKWTEISLR